MGKSKTEAVQVEPTPKPSSSTYADSLKPADLIRALVGPIDPARPTFMRIVSPSPTATMVVFVDARTMTFTRSNDGAQAPPGTQLPLA